jgi:sulfite reductase alpha subunit-like flavoprotein
VCSADVGQLLSVIPRLQPRPYSIASSPSLHKGQVHLCVAMVRVASSLEAARGARRGICSSFLAALGARSILPIAISNQAKGVGWGGLTFDFAKPAVLVGPGTGIAPMRAFLHELHYRRQRGDASLCPVLAFFGFRHKLGDFLYGHELCAWTREKHTRESTAGILGEPKPVPASNNDSSSLNVSIHIAFSRDFKNDGRLGKEDLISEHDGEHVEENGGKDYVQHHILREGKRVWELLRQGGSVYVAGSGGAMPRDVERALCRTAEMHGGLGPQQAQEWAAHLRISRRLQIECW